MPTPPRSPTAVGIRPGRPAGPASSEDRAAAHPGAHARGPQSLGVDAARGIAVLALVAGYVAPRPQPGGRDWPLAVCDGWAPAAFMLIAGFSLALAHGGATSPPLRSRFLRPALNRCAVPAGLGLWLAAMDPGIPVILTSCAVCLLAAEPLARLRPVALAGIAAASLLVGPVLSYVLGPLPLSGACPFLAHFPYVLAGVALGRIADLSDPAIQRRVFGWGTACALTGYGGSWLALGPFGGRGALLRAIAEHHPWAMGSSDPVRAVVAQQYGAIPSSSYNWLLVASPHSQTPFETLANAGVGAALIAAALMACRGPLRLVRALRPVAAVGAMALSVYVVQALALAGPAHGQSGWTALFAFTAAALAACAAWRWCWHGTPLQRGPLEWGLTALSAHLRLRLPATHGGKGRRTTIADPPA